MIQPRTAADFQADNVRIAIVGAGIRGLTSAAHLKRLGYQVSIFDKAMAPGGIWPRVYPTSVINSPAHGYTFHTSNQWQSNHPSRDEVLRNVDRLIEQENLAGELRIGTPVNSVIRSPCGRWQINDETLPFDGLLACTGFLGERKQPAPETVAKFNGSVLLPYAFDPEILRDRRVIVLGSGSTALEMLRLAHTSQSRSATLVVRPGTRIRDTNRIADAKFWISSNPFLYAATKRGGGQAAAVAPDASSILACEGVSVVEDDFVCAEQDQLILSQDRRISADLVIWCTGWHSPTPSWVERNREHPNLVAATCPRCLDTAGFGFGASTIYAKLLDCILRYGLTTAFNPSDYGCECEAEPCRHGPNIMISAMRYLYAQPGGRRIILKLAANGFQANRRRLRETQEPLWISLLSFANAPFGL